MADNAERAAYIGRTNVGTVGERRSKGVRRVSRVAAAAMIVLTEFAIAIPALASDLYVVDGDTLNLGREKIRLTSDAGPIDAPEIHAEGYAPARCPAELQRARAARARLVEILAEGDWSIDRRGRDGHERSLAVVYSKGEDVAAILVREGHARPWPRPFRGNKPDWCDDRR